MVKQKSKRGYPLIELTDEQKKKVRDLASISTTQQITDYFGVCRETFRQMRIRDEEVSSHYKKGSL